MRAYLLFEAVVALVVSSVLFSLGADVISRVYKESYIQKRSDDLELRADLLLAFLEKKLPLAVKNSVISLECGLENEGCFKGEITNYKKLGLNAYAVEWIGKDLYAQIGEWNESLKRVVGYSGFVDLNKTQILGEDEYKIYSPLSDFRAVDDVIRAYFQNFQDQKDLKAAALIFSGRDGNGDFEELNNSYGYYRSKALKVFEIKNFSTQSLEISAFSKSNSSNVYESFFLTKSAYAIVPKCTEFINSKCVEFELVLFFNYRPWRGEVFANAKHITIAKGLYKFEVSALGDGFEVNVCLKKDDFHICKKRVIY
ncbi:MAG: hypothetical protein GXO62_01525 [Epsilonproteobacteria bacterium]|nr:hypothetical protein [Campylobacterota bacterium]